MRSYWTLGRPTIGVRPPPDGPSPARGNEHPPHPACPMLNAYANHLPSSQLLSVGDVHTRVRQTDSRSLIGRLHLAMSPTDGGSRSPRSRRHRMLIVRRSNISMAHREEGVGCLARRLRSRHHGQEVDQAWHHNSTYSEPRHKFGGGMRRILCLIRHPVGWRTPASPRTAMGAMPIQPLRTNINSFSLKILRQNRRPRAPSASISALARSVRLKAGRPYPLYNPKSALRSSSSSRIQRHPRLPKIPRNLPRPDIRISTGGEGRPVRIQIDLLRTSTSPMSTSTAWMRPSASIHSI